MYGAILMQSEKPQTLEEKLTLYYSDEMSRRCGEALKELVRIIARSAAQRDFEEAERKMAEKPKRKKP